MQTESVETAWHLDKRVPIALIMALIIQAAGAIWWASAMDRRVVSLEASIHDVASYRLRVVRLQERQSATTDRLSQIDKQLASINAKLDKLIETFAYANRNGGR